LNEAGLVHLLRAEARLALLGIVEPARRPVVQELARHDLEEARFLCPALPAVKRLDLLSTRNLEAEDLDVSEILRRYPNDAEVLVKLAEIAMDRDDAGMAAKFRHEACLLNPLSEQYVCD